MADICVVGGLNMDLVVRTPHIPRAGETVQGGQLARFIGGKGANQAVAASRLGSSVAMIGQVGADPFGDELLDALKGEGVDGAGVRRLSGAASGVALIAVATNGENSIVVAPGANMSWSDEAIADVEKTVAACPLLVLPLEVPPSVVIRAVQAAKRGGSRVILNPAPHRTGDEACFPDVDVFVPNQVEAACFAGAHPEAVQDWGDIGRRLQSRGPRTVIITLGGEGAVIANQDGVTHVPGFHVPVLDTTAAGDAFVGGLAVAVQRGLPLPEAVRFANACGAVAVTRAGAQPSLPRRGEVEQLLARREGDWTDDT